jgi:predicted phosphohydrolase
MRLLITSDLHYRPSQRETYLQFSRWVQAQAPDCLVIAGDVGHPLRLFRRALQLFAELDCPKLVLAGNHDVYRGEFDSRTLWEAELPNVAREEGFCWLEDETRELDLSEKAAWSDLRPRKKASARNQDQPTKPKTLGIVGTMAWYDYSSAAPHAAYDDADYRVLKRLVNHDADYVDWPWSDRAMARYLGRRFAARLASLVDNPAVDQIVVVTHVPIFAEAAPHYPENEFYSLMRAYLGNFTLGELVRQQPKVTHVIRGHIHHRGHWIVNGAHGPIDFRLVGSHRGVPAAVVLDL